jgi:hypothetical protein
MNLTSDQVFQMMDQSDAVTTLNFYSQSLGYGACYTFVIIRTNVGEPVLRKAKEKVATSRKKLSNNWILCTNRTWSWQ